MAFPTSLQLLKPLIEARGIKLRREWGQNLLVDANMLAAIIRDSGVGPNDVVLEIGVGAGSLTHGLSDAARLVVGVDIDRGMLSLARELLGDRTNVVTIRCDVMGAHNQLNPRVVAVLRAALVHAGVAGAGNGAEDDELVDDDGEAVSFPSSMLGSTGGSFRVVANLPYSISSPVLLALMESGLPIASMTLMLQLEVARKLCAKPGDDEWGLLAILAGELADSKLLRKVPAACFWPRPKVDSATVEVIPSPGRSTREEYDQLRKVVHGLFQQRRKNVLNGAKLGLGLSSEEARAWLARAGVDPSNHAESLAVADLRRLAATYTEPSGDSTR